MIKAYNMIEFGNELKSIRLRLNLSQKRINSLTGVNRDTIRRIEQGSVIPTFDTILKLSTVYHQDLMHLFSKYANNHGLNIYYEEIDLAVLYGHFDDINLIKDEITRVVIEKQALNVTVDPIELKQFQLYYQALYLIHEDDTGNYSKIESLVKEILSARHEQYELRAFRDYHYTFIEQRALFTYANLFESSNIPKYFAILEYLYSIDTTVNSHPSVLFRLKILLNLIINYYVKENDQKVISLANTAISLALMHHVTYYLGEFYIHKGISQFFLKEGDYMASLKCGYYTSRATGFDERLKELVAGVKNACNIDLENC